MTEAVLPAEDRRGFGIALMLAAFFCFTMIDTCAKWLVLSGLPPLEVAFIRYAGHLAIMVALVSPRDWRTVARTNAPLVAILRGGFLAGATILNFFSLRYLPLSVTSAIFSQCRFGSACWADRCWVSGSARAGPRRW